MGSYGIGVARCMAAIAEQYADDNGLVWPVAVAPFTVSIVIINTKDDVQNDLANSLYDKFRENNIDVLLDDRDERAGVKFKDMDLIGIPYRITVGKKATDNIVEFKSRDGKIDEEVSADEIIDKIKELIK